MTRDNAPENDEKEGRTEVKNTRGPWCLRLVVLIQSVGICGKYFLAGFESESDVYGFLFFDHGWPEIIAQRIDDGGAVACLIAGVTVAFSGLVMARNRVRSSVDLISLAIVATWFLAISITHTLRGEPFSSLSLGEHAVRYAVPLSLAIILMKQSKSGGSVRCAVTVLVVASSATFVVHGYKALVQYGPFTDLILLSDANLLGLGITQSTAEFALTTIGIVDLAVAVLLVTTRWRAVAVYMALWGLLTSFSRMTAFGITAWPETAIRAANWGAPLVLVIYDGLSKTSDSIKEV